MRLFIHLGIWLMIIMSLHPHAGYGQIPALPIQEGIQTAYPLPNASGMGFYEYLPAGYGNGTLFPLVVFFHGQSERGNGIADLSKVLKNGPPKLINAGADFPAIVISPQLSDTRNNWSIAITTPFVEYILANYDIDTNRIYVTGLSLGGGGAWIYAKAHHDLVAAVVPICGTESNTGYEVLSNMPVWAFHSEGDPTVPFNNSNAKLRGITGIAPNESRPIDNYQPGYTGSFMGGQWVWRRGYEALPPGGKAHFTVFERTSHDAWTDTYANDMMWDWLFAQTRSTQFQSYVPLITK